MRDDSVWEIVIDVLRYNRHAQKLTKASLICRTEPNEKETKTEMRRRNGPVMKCVESVLRPGRASMVGKICERGRSERERELWMVRVVSWQAIEYEQASHRQREYSQLTLKQKCSQ